MAAVPYQPQGLNAEQDSGQILLTWSASLWATSYQIQRSMDGVNFSDYAVTGVNTAYAQTPKNFVDLPPLRSVRL